MKLFKLKKQIIENLISERFKSYQRELVVCESPKDWDVHVYSNKDLNDFTYILFNNEIVFSFYKGRESDNFFPYYGGILHNLPIETRSLIKDFAISIDFFRLSITPVRFNFEGNSRFTDGESYVLKIQKKNRTDWII